jgi:hypothetical protein
MTEFPREREFLFPERKFQPSESKRSRMFARANNSTFWESASSRLGGIKQTSGSHRDSFPETNLSARADNSVCSTGFQRPFDRLRIPAVHSSRVNSLRVSCLAVGTISNAANPGPKAGIRISLHAQRYLAHPRNHHGESHRDFVPRQNGSRRLSLHVQRIVPLAARLSARDDKFLAWDGTWSRNRPRARTNGDLFTKISLRKDI